MSSVRRWYIFLVAAISLQAVAWAMIELLRNLMEVWGARSNEAIAFQVAVIVIGLPVFLIHWLWAQRLAGSEQEERSAFLRRLYLYGTMAALLMPWIGSVYNLSQGLLGLLLDPNGTWHGSRPFLDSQNTTKGLLNDLTPLLILGLLWLYHRQVTRNDAIAVPLSVNNALVRRLYLLGFSFGGLIQVVQGATALVRWLLYQFGGATAMAGRIALIDPLASLLIGLPLWAICWYLAQQLFQRDDPGERESALRKFYLHTIVFLSTLVTVTGTTLILFGMLRQAFGLPPQGDIRDALPVVLVAALIWAYHSWVLRTDTALIAELPRQAGVRRLSWYLVASIGLAASLIGLGGIFSGIIKAIGAPNFGDDLREQLSWSLAALIAGLPMWLLVWRRAEGIAEAENAGGDHERGSLVRRIYLYGFLFAATITILGGLVYIVFRLLRIALGERPEGNLVADLAQAIAFSCIAAGILAYHGGILRSEGRRRQAAQATRAAQLRVAVLDLAEGAFGRAIIERLRSDLPGLALSPIGLNPAAAAGMGTVTDSRSLAAQLADASLIIGPWQIAVPHTVSAEVAQAVGASTARKLLLPMPSDGWSWVGVEPWNSEAAIGQIVQAVRQILNGEPIRPVRPLPPLALLGIVLGAIFLVIILIGFVLFTTLR